MAVKYILDTNMCIYSIQKHFYKLDKKISEFFPGDLGISSLTMAELHYGVRRSMNVDKNLRALESFLLTFEILPFDDQAAMMYGELRADLQKSGTSIGPLDMLIAAHARSINIPLVTNNVREFLRVRGLQVENWLA